MKDFGPLCLSAFLTNIPPVEFIKRGEPLMRNPEAVLEALGGTSLTDLIPVYVPSCITLFQLQLFTFNKKEDVRTFILDHVQCVSASCLSAQTENQ